MTIFVFYYLIANFDKIAVFFFTKVGNIDQKAVPVMEAMGAFGKFSISFSGLGRSGLLSKTSGISDAEDSEQNEQAEEDSGGFHCFNYFFIIL